MKYSLKKYFIIGVLFFCGMFYSVRAYADGFVQADLYTWDDATPDNPYDSIVTYQEGIQFPGVFPAGLTYEEILENSWYHSSQFIRVRYSSDAQTWGIRIYTNNNTDLQGVAPKVIGQGAGPDGDFGTSDDNWDSGPDGIPGTSDDTLSVSYGGMINTATKRNPYFRVQLVWQVYKDPVSRPGDIFKNWRGVWNAGGNWYDDWAYIVDESDRWNRKAALANEVYYPDPDPDPDPGTPDPRFEMIVTGCQEDSFLAQHPIVNGSITNPIIKQGDGDIAVYIAGCFAVPSDNVQGAFTGLVPLGTYNTTIYVELIQP